MSADVQARLAADCARMSAWWQREMHENTRLRKCIVDLQQQLDDAHAMLAAQSEVLVRHQHRDQRHATR